ncbi:MAG TPA: putative glycoside hydrolase, partial [Acidimicrobiia bacterium]|nr:putative glycoside hydrolase [Acidimicrobiia bacterium]
LRLAAVITVVLVAVVVWNTLRVRASATGVEDGGAITPEAVAEATINISISRGSLEDATLRLDGTDVTSKAEITDGRLSWKPGPLAEGDHTLELHVPRSILPDATVEWDFTVDGRPPTITAPPYLPPHQPDDPVDIEGTVVGAETLTVDGEPVDVASDGSFSLHFDRPPTDGIDLVAVDDAGNERHATVFVPVPYPDDVRGVHVTATAWDNANLRQGIIDLINDGLVNTVVLTIKDEGGLVGHESNVAAAHEVGAVQGLYDLKKQVDYLHSKGVYVVGRIVCFRDPKYADAAWERGDREMLIQSPDGDRYALYGGGFLNFSHPEVQQYNIDLAVEAVKAGVDDVLYDYVRRPDGLIETMKIPGLEGDPIDSVVEFMAKSHGEIRRLGAVQGASVFGIAATRPEQIAQDILAMASNADYIAPMLYPSHWNPGEYGVADPDRQPYDIVFRSLRDFRQQVARTGRPLVPWLQHFSLGSTYTTAEIRAQVRASRDQDSNGWLMWDPGVTYNPEGLREDSRAPRIPAT